MQSTLFAGVSAKEWTDTDVSEFSRFIRDTMKTLQVPGASVGVVDKSGKIIFKEHFGVKDLDTKEPVVDGTLFRIGSSTKSMTTALMAMLVQKGLMEWDDPIKKHLSEFQLLDPAWTSTMTMRQSMSAATGMPRRDAELLYKYCGSAEDRIAEMQVDAPTSKFGEAFQYSNPLVAAGGYATGRAYCKDGSLMKAYQKAIHEALFCPLGMNSVEWELGKVVKLNHGIPHGLDHRGNMVSFRVEEDDFPYSVAPAGGAWCNLDDFLKFVQFELNEGSVNGKQLVNREIYLQRHKPMVAMSETASYGLGLMLDTLSGVPIAGHGGNSLGFSSDFCFLPEHGVGIAIISNASQAAGFTQALRSKFLETIFSTSGQSSAIVESAAQTTKGLVEALKARLETDPEEIASALASVLENEYYNKDIGKMSFYRQGSDYFMKIGDFESLVVTEKGEKVLIVPVGPHVLLMTAILGYKYILEPDGSITHDTGQVVYSFKAAKPQ
jgi:CubicO group peptidase (beta-lactamase class C family)